MRQEGGFFNRLLTDYAEFKDQLGEQTPHRPVLIAESRFRNPFMWTGQRYDGETGLYHFRFRSYSTALGRWLQRDPLGYVDGASLREYVFGNPVAYSDPFGLSGGGNMGDDIDDAIEGLGWGIREGEREKHGLGLTDAEKKRAAEAAAEIEQELVDGFLETGKAMGEAAYEAYELAGYASIAGIAAHAVKAAGIKVIMSLGKKKFLNECGEEISEEAAKALIKKSLSDHKKALAKV